MGVREKEEGTLFRGFLLPPGYLTKESPMSKRTLGVVFFPAFDWAISPTHPEREERLLYTQDQLREEGLFDLPGITEYKPGVATHEDIERVHFCLPDVGRVCSASHLASAGGAIRAGELVLSGERERAFALVRPPGHHAMRVTHGNRGFCNVNMEAVMIGNAHDQIPAPPLRAAACGHRRYRLPSWRRYARHLLERS